MPNEKEAELNAEEMTLGSDAMYDAGFKKGFIRGISGALVCIMNHETCSGEDAMNILHIKEDEREWYRPFLKEHAGENWGVVVALSDMEKAKKGIQANADKNIKITLPVLLRAISENTLLESAGLDDFLGLIVKLRKSSSLGAGVELDQYYKMLWEIEKATEAIPASVRLFGEIEKKYHWEIEKQIR